MACWNTEENMDSKVSPKERRLVCVMIYLLRDSETMLKVCDDSKIAGTGMRKRYTTLGKSPNNRCHT